MRTGRCELVRGVGNCGVGRGRADTSGCGVFGVQIEKDEWERCLAGWGYRLTNFGKKRHGGISACAWMLTKMIRCIHAWALYASRVVIVVQKRVLLCKKV